MALKHTDFMRSISKTIGGHLPGAYQGFRLGETRWYMQLYFGSERLIHYEVSRPWSRIGRQIEIGLHFESRNRSLNQELLFALDRYLPEIKDQLNSDVKAEIWDRGWTKVYEIHPDQDLSESLVKTTASRLAKFITVVQPIYQSIRQDS
ncbi:MAG TPA: hypothetical protein VJZ27_09885 [Aggregatilineales bacterium]|nr:hypothetical protein [Aggregatilineales bacterium]